jgi:hypothetical protein
MKLRTKAWLEFGVFCAVFGALIDIHQHYHALDHWMALIWLSFLVVAGVYALIRTYSGKSQHSIAFLNALPRRPRPNSRVTRCHLDHRSANRVFMSRSNRPYGFTCSQISGVNAA